MPFSRTSSQTSVASRAAFILACLLLLPFAAQADFTTLWSLGARDGNPDEFGGEDFVSNASPGSAAAKDDDYYFAGAYPAPINTIATSEPTSNAERAVSGGDPVNRYHFTLTSEQVATGTLRVRLVAHFIWGGWWDNVNQVTGSYYGTHNIEVRLNNQVIGTQTFVGDGTLVVESNAGPGGFTPVAGENVLRISRTGGTNGGYMIFDDLSFEINPTALSDADTDGLPQWWEQDQGLNDSNSADAAQDTDNDGLTNSQEFAAKTLAQDADTDEDGLPDGVETNTGVWVSASNTGSNPLLADTDGDSLTDGFEAIRIPLLHPLLADCDGDGASDAWEYRTGYYNSVSTPPAWNQAIGLQFVSQETHTSALTAQEVTGFVPQRHWNRTTPITTWNTPNGSTASIAGPVSGTLVNCAGANTSTTVSWTSDHSWFTGNGGGSNQRLLDGHLVASHDTPASVTLNNIPYTTYDVLVYVGDDGVGAHGYTRLNNNTATDRHFAAHSTRPVSSFLEPAVSSETRPWRGNVIRYRNVTGASVNVTLRISAEEESWASVGLHGIQVVNSTFNTDGDAMPDWWEFMHTLKPHLASDATLDPDGDGLTHAQEFARDTNPRLADTDGDGLNDAVETGTGTWVSATDTGSSPFLPDTDGDTISDGDEVSTLPQPTNPNVADTDGDGRSDADERAHRSDPVVSTSASAQMPVVSTSPRTFDWTLDNVQFVWDHTRGHMAAEAWGDTYLAQLSINNSVTESWDHALRFALRHVRGKLVHFFYSGNAGGFSYSNSPGDDIWESDWNTNPTDRTAALGFSGYGTHDISDRLRFRLTGSSTGAQNAWSITFELYNMDTSAAVRSVTFNSCTASAGIQNGSAVWVTDDDPGIPHRISIDLHPGVSVYFQPTPLENTPAFAVWKDTDEDGMPDAWETTYSFNINIAADATTDADNDGLSNRRECLAGTNPHQRDSDGDQVADGLEVSSGSNPLLASSRPPFANGPGVSGEDFNGNGMSDAWEMWAGSLGLGAGDDADGDGQTNLQESLAGTNPYNANSRFTSTSIRSGNDLILRWTRLPDKFHRVWQSSTLNSWSLASGTPTAVGSDFQQTFANALISGGPRVFYRAGVNDIDTDSDGVSDWTEINVLHSNPANANSLRASMATDANNDGVTDGTISGDLATLIERFQGGGSTGGYANGGGSPATGTGISRASAARFLTQASFGPTPEDIEQVQQLGYDGWIEAQKAKPITLQSTYLKQIHADYFGPRADSSYNGSDMDEFLFGNNMNTAFARAAIQGEDQLRQRIAFALSQILVTSRRDANLENQILGMADYYDIFVSHAFGNYFDVLCEVTLHPVMGRYLSHIGNQKARPEINQYPDENYAREVMQLFSIGLWELNPDGTRQVNGSGANIPTYSNTQITQFARVMTGLWFGGQQWGNGGWSNEDYATPMSMHEDRHDFGTKTLLRGFVIPARTPSREEGLRDVRDAIQNLFDHPNCAPFIGKQLIQFLVTDNPSPAYVARVSAVFADNGSGVRGDLGAVVKTILLDDEARSPAHSEHAPQYGRLKEPVIRAMALGRAFGMKNVPNLLWWDWGDFFADSRQEPTYSPSVFNFYRPEYRAAGLLTQQNLAGPVFQITDSYSSIAFPNRLWSLIADGFTLWGEYEFPIDLSRESALAATPELLVDHLNTIFCAGRMSAATRAVILNAVNQIPASEADSRARIAAYLAMVCPEGAVMK